MLGQFRINEGLDNVFTKLPKGEKLIIGCVHLLPMPNTPFYTEGDYERSLEKAVKDAKTLIEGGATGCIVQTVDRLFPNTDDTDYIRVAGMSVIGNEIKRMAPKDFRIGLQIMWNCITPSLAAARAVGADFTRCTALVGRTESPYGEIVAQPLMVQNYRKNIGAQNIAMIAEVAGYHFLTEGGYDKKKLISTAKNALLAGANAIEVFHNDEAINESMVCDLKEAYPEVPVILGGGTNIENAARRLKYADGAIVGSCFEKGNWGGEVQLDAVQAYMETVRTLKG